MGSRTLKVVFLSIFILLALPYSVLGAAREALVAQVQPIAFLGGPGTDPSYPAAHLCDGDLGTVWRTGPGVGSSWCTCYLPEARTLTTLEIYLAGEAGGEISVSYHAGGLWLPVPHGPGRWTAGWNRIDLASSKVCTDRLRLMVTNPGAPGILGNIGEIRVWAGSDGLPRRLMPAAVSGEADERFPVTALADGNTDTPWALPTGQNTGSCNIDLDSRARAEMVRLYACGADSRVTLTDQAGVPVLRQAPLQPGWNTFPLDGGSRFEVVIEGADARLGEIEFWGMPPASAPMPLLLPIGRDLPAGASCAASFPLSPADLAGADLTLMGRGDLTALHM